MALLARTLKEKAHAHMEKIAAAALPLIRNGCSLRYGAQELRREGWTTFQVTYANGFVAGGKPLHQAYLYKVITACPAVKAVWEEQVEARVKAYEEEEAAKAAFKRAAKEAAEQARQRGQKRAPAPILLGRVAKALVTTKRRKLAKLAAAGAEAAAADVTGVMERVDLDFDRARAEQGQPAASATD